MTTGDPEGPRWLDDAQDPALRKLRQALDEAEPVAPSDVRQRRVWARVEDPRRARHAVRRAFLMGALVTAAVGAIALWSADRVRPAPGGLGGERARRETPRPAAPASRPAARDPVVRAAPDAPAGTRPALIRAGGRQAVIRALRPGIEAEVRPGALLAVDEGGRVAVRAGVVNFTVAPQPPGTPFSVQAGAFTARVVGTRFAVRVDGDVVRVAVDQGVVEVWEVERIARLSAGESWSNARRRAAAAPGPEPPSPGAEPGLAEARAARAGADPDRALAIYQRLASQRARGTVAENALYEIGGIYRDELGKPRQALAAWERYRSQYPSGLLRAEADISIIDTLSSLGDGARVLDEALAFLARYPRSERRGEVARLAGDLYRARGSCREAIALYGKVAAAGTASPADTDDAAFGRAACLAALRDPEAAAALAAYVRDRPRGRHHAEAQRLSGRTGQADEP